jgi:membrane dipeptidase
LTTVDCTHTAHRTTLEAMEASVAPCIFSHCNTYTLVPHYRNIHDDQIRKCAETGGLIGVNGLGEFLDDMQAQSESMFRHIDHIVSLVGPQHADIGLDYVRDSEGFWDFVAAHPTMWPPNNAQARRRTAFAQPEQVQELAELMCRHNYSDGDIRCVLGENFYRVCKQVWK